VLNMDRMYGSAHAPPYIGVAKNSFMLAVYYCLF
jgi:hypothetical protein